MVIETIGTPWYTPLITIGLIGFIGLGLLVILVFLKWGATTKSKSINQKIKRQKK